MMIPPGECMYAGRKRRKPLQKQRPALGAEKSNPSKRHRDRLNAELDHLASLLPFPPDVISKLDKLSVLRLSVSYLRVKSFFQAVQEQCSRQAAAGAPSPGDGHPRGGSAVLEGRLLLESLNGFALVVSAEGMIFYASATIVDYLGFHQTDVMHQNIYDYIHVDDRQDFCRQLHWAMDPPQLGHGQPPHVETGENAVLGRLLRAQQGGAGLPTEFSAFLTRCFVCRVRCLLDSTSGFLTMQFQGKLRFLFGQKKKAPSGTVLPPRLSLFCVVVPVLWHSAAEVKMKSALLRAKHKADPMAIVDAKVKASMNLCESELHGKPNYFEGRSSRENGLLVFRAQPDAGCWARVPARAPCLCLRDSPDLVLDPKGAAGARDKEQERVPSSCSGGRGQREAHVHSCHLEKLGPLRRLDCTAGQHGEDGSVTLKLQPSKGDLVSKRPVPCSPCLPYPGAQGTFNASGTTTFRNSPSCHPPSSGPGAYSSQASRPGREVDESQVHAAPCCYPHGSLQSQLPQLGVRHFATGAFSAQDGKLQGLQMSPGGLCGPMLPLEVPIKMEHDSGSEDAVDGYVPSQLWPGTSDVAKGHLATFPTRMHLKAEPDSRQPGYTPHLGHDILGTPLHSRATAMCYPAHGTHLEHMPDPPLLDPHCHHHAQGRHEAQALLPGCTCRAVGSAPVVKREPLDSPPWATPSQGRVPEVFPKSALAMLIPPRAPECTFLL
ncbi:aryl hydrocarbon receptor repressor [Carlito syrichta]|uniref:Aryl hydrocarbon receptor repressor n=1 Tax=Carlito syrichta TaxID=1868482 RepID=A0A1U7UYM0_CARSF|nr:aryl hydrocarbon receptor repressor [Carlito syrichta]